MASLSESLFARGGLLTLDLTKSGIKPAGATADKIRDWLAVRSCGHHLMHLLTPIGLVSYSITRLATELHHIIQSDGGRGDYSLITQSNGGRGDYPLVLVVPRSGSTDGKVV